MQQLQFSVTINAPKETVWHTMLDDKTYREWTAVFSPGSYYQGSWEQGSKILFIGPDPETGEEGGMVSRIAENRLYEFISIEHLGILTNGVEDTTSEEAKKWAPAHENYTLKEVAGVTTLTVDVDVEDEYVDMFSGMWPEALQKLKALAEGGAKEKITVQTVIDEPISVVWQRLNTPADIKKWAFASEDWEVPAAENDLKVGGRFSTTMAMKEGLESFDVTGVYTTVVENKLIEYTLDDGREVRTELTETTEGTKVTQTFDPEDENSHGAQRAGWQAILDNFKKYVENPH